MMRTCRVADEFPRHFPNVEVNLGEFIEGHLETAAWRTRLLMS